MQVIIKIILTTKPAKTHLKEMYNAAKSITNNKSDIRISIDKLHNKVVIAEFTIKKARQSDMVDKIGDSFFMFMKNYSNTIISFPK